jgi:P27 family predicted phage terminase small subunit
VTAMPRGGQNVKPTLAVIKEGNPGKRPIKDAVVLPPSALREPDWSELLQGDDVEVARARAVAAELWARVAPTLARSVGLVGEQQETLVDYCVTYARIVQGERALSREGVIVRTERGQVKNAWTTVLNQYRPHFRSLVGELGLSPSAATRLTRPAGGDDDDPFD